ncbi:uncharacterized protein LOC129945988 [Eupeodes corollae]|uniref:uncharacterized protein LOC129945988 n=1 Tax=Eupeodes corollae TaxID=290404 RepID=UPI00248F8872|nr:uncharacterized protein LOC129945988 [Eupeodes corollae]
MSADSPRRSARGIPAIVPPQVVSDRSIIDSVAGFINDVTLNNQPQCDPKDTITWARFETAADISDTRFCDDWELEGNVAPPLLLILGYGQGVQVWAIPANGEAVEVLSWRHGIVSALRVLPTPSYADNGRADEPIDAYADKRPLMALCDGTTPAGSNPQFCAVNFVSLKTGAQVKTIKFKNPVLDILANRSSIVITFHERIAVFDSRSLEDRLSVTTCFPSPGINPNPVALGTRWMAYSENKLLHSKRSGGGCDGDGVASYTATVLNAAKSFGKGLRELGEQVAAGLTGTTGSGGSSKSSSFDSATGDVRQGGVVTILDIKHPIKDVSPTSGTPISINGSDPIVAHFIAHSEAVVAMEFDNSGMMLLTADKRGHDFHLFRIQPHPVGSSLAAVHHIYVLHRGDTSAKVQNITFSLDSRWVAVSTLRGTTHVFPVTPYGGPAGVRTHTSLHVVNKLSRFHRSAGLTADGRSSSPISHSDSTNFSQILMPYHNPTMPPFPRPTVVLPLAQLRQPFALGSPPGSAVPSSYGKTSNTRQRLSSLSDDNGKPLSVCAVFAKSRSWLLDPPNAAREAPHKIQRKAVDSLFVMAGHGALIQYDLDTKLATNVAKEKICDDTPIELEVEAKAQWNLSRKDGSPEIMPPLSVENWLLKDKNSCMLIDSTRQYEDSDDRSDSWLSQVEIITHAGPHRRLWMGPQFVFKTYNTPSGSNLSHIDVEAVEIGVSSGPSSTSRPERSSPLNMPLTATGRSAVPVLIESGSYSSIEQSPKLMDRFRHEHMNSDFSVAHGDNRLKEDLADAMRESPSVSHKDSGGQPQRRRLSAAGSSRATTSPSSSPKPRSGSGGVSSASSTSSSSAVTLVGGCGDAGEFTSKYESLESLIQQQQQQQSHIKAMSIEKVVNPLGTVTTITGSCDSDLDTDDVLKNVSAQSYVIHENCDESLFRPVVAIFCDENIGLDAEQFDEDSEYTKPPEAIGNKLIVPVIEKAVDLELTKKESLKNRGRRQQKQLIQKVKEESDDEVVKFNIADVKRKQKIDKKKPRVEEQEDISVNKNPLTKAGIESDPSTSLSSKSKLKIQPEDEAAKLKASSTSLSKTNKSYRGNENEEVSEDLSGLERHADHFEIKSTSDKDSKLKSTKSRKSVERDPLSDEVDNKKKFSDNEVTKTRKSLEKDIVSDEVDCNKKTSSDKGASDKAGKSKTLKSRRSLEKEILPVDDTQNAPVVHEKKSSAKNSKPKIIKMSESTNPLSEEDLSKSSSLDNVPKVAVKSKISKGRKSPEKDVESSSDSQTSSVIESVKSSKSQPSVENEVPKSLKILEKDLVSDELNTLETHFENDEKPKTVEKNETKSKTSKIRKSVERDVKTPEKSIENNSKNGNSRKSSVVEMPVAEAEASSKKTKKNRKSEEREIVIIPKSSSTEEQQEDRTQKTKKERASEDKNTEEIRRTSLDKEQKLKKKDSIEEVTVKNSVKVQKSSKSKKSPEDETVAAPVILSSLLQPEDFEDEKPIEFKRMTGANSNKIVNKNSKIDKTIQAKSDSKAKSTPQESKSDTLSDSKDLSDITTNKKKNRGELLKKSSQDIKAEEVPLTVELSNASDLADSLLDFHQDKTEDVKSSSVDTDKTKKRTDEVKECKVLPEPDIKTVPDKSVNVTLSEKESKKTLKKSKPDKVATPPSELLGLSDNIAKPKDTIINVEEKDADTMKTQKSSLEKTSIKPGKKVTKDTNKPDKISEPKRRQSDESVRSRSNSVISVKTDKLLELSALPSKLEDEITTKTAEPDFLSELADSQKAIKPKDSAEANSKSLKDSPEKTLGSPLKFVDTYDDNFIAPEIPLKKDKSKKKQTSVKVAVEKPSDKLDSAFKSCDEIQFFDSFLQEGAANASVEAATPWKPIVKVEEKTKLLSNDFPSLGKPMKTKKSQSPPKEKTELPPFTIDIRDEKKDNKNSMKMKTKILDDIPLLQPLEELPIDFLPPLAPLEPLEGTDENISLINFESPLQEASKPIKPEAEVEKVPSSTQFPKGFPADNIIFALCGSLHYENENSGKPVDSPLTLSFSDSTAHTTAEYKSLTENDDQYLSLEQSSQENNPSTSSSTCEDVTEAAYSSGGGGGDNGGDCSENINPATGKTKNKQRRKKQLITAAQDDDEELRPLISKNDDVNLMTCSMTKTNTKTSEMTSVHKTKPLPTSDDNNQVNSDSSSSDQAMTSEDTDGQTSLTKTPGKSLVDEVDKSAEDEADMAGTSSIHQSTQQAQSQQQQQQPSSSKKKLKRRKR